ncbi:MAG: histidine kinase [Bacteroidales bacterium]|jgi:LytS/YehU family sensor histidine kinase|nr:histidine kinase [Bacteroidales bacterium]HOI33253.1 histidine kinase [Bacteroidales bacterium]
MAAAALLFAGMNWRIRYLRQQQKRKYEIQQQLAELKLQALQAQMNPHFIFNVLTAFQNAILKNEIDNAIHNLSYVSRLMRRTLDYASEKFISLEEEVEYIENYIRLEKIRMNGKLETQIFVDPKLDLQNTRIPPMLLQPLIENDIKHGTNKAKDSGIINIRFEQISPEGYQCVVEDNGPGIAPESKSTHKSRGLDMINTSIQLLNEEFGETAFSFIISNKIKPDSGARMEIKLPLQADTDL